MCSGEKLGGTTACRQIRENVGWLFIEQVTMLSEIGDPSSRKREEMKVQMIRMNEDKLN